MLTATEQPKLGVKNRRVCSYDITIVTDQAYVVTEANGEMFFCNSRCLCLWAIMFVTKPNLTDDIRTRHYYVRTPAGDKIRFKTLRALARWACNQALGEVV